MKLSLMILLAAFLLPAPTLAQTTKESTRMHAIGNFDIKVQPQTADNPQAKSSGLTRLSLDKHFHGDLEAPSQGEMLAAGDGSAAGAYVALEKVTGTLHGQRGSFALVHRSLLVDGKPKDWTVEVVPGSGTEQLAGLAGTMTITMVDGQHRYDFSYTLPEH